MRLTAIALSGALLLSTPFAAAADQAAVAQARVLFNDGLRLFRAGQYEQSRAKFAAANALVESDDILYNLALAEANSGHPADALNHYRAYRRTSKPRPADVSLFETKWLPQLESRVGQLSIDGSDGETVSIDGEAVGALPFPSPYAVQPGHHVVEGRAGADVTRRDLEMTSGQIVTVHLAPQAIAPGPAPVPEPVATFNPAAPSPTASTPAPATDAGAHGGAAPLRTWLTVGLGAGAVALAAGGVFFGAQSNSAGNEAVQIRNGFSGSSCVNPSAAGCSQLNDDVHTADRDRTISIVLYAGAGALAAGALASFLFLPRTTETRSAVVPIAGPGIAGAGWTTTF